MQASPRRRRPRPAAGARRGPRRRLPSRPGVARYRALR
jgi:hypothetical protein